ncbi:hypothetical protein [Streptomyces sp. BE230]|uniref:hypothetical protein n=1 Tax=Streptomyces sp. BE230 TaxID=3002526 RepID=UPI002ED49672|nr:hypothetical protein [Streptomyces sp. BE230]
MDAGVIALLVAAVGVAGTLLAPITTTWVGSRARLQEFELQQRAEQAKRRSEEAQQNLERRRETYVALNSATRRYRILMMEDVHALREGDPLDADGAIETARLEFQDIYAQAQMLIPDSVLGPCHDARVALAEARKGIAALHREAEVDQEAWRSVHADVMQVWDLIRLMQEAMREDLGITESLSAGRIVGQLPYVPDSPFPGQE